MRFALEFDHLHKQYGSFTALQDVHFNIEEGCFFALLGPNGAGKTTLISILAGLTRASAGHARVMGCDVRADPIQARRLLGVVPQELVFDPFFTVREALQFQSGYFGLRRNEAWIDALLERLGLADKAQTNMRALSGGMKRRVMVAQALVHRPPVIVLDEPTAGVDVELRQQLWSFIQELNAQGHTILLTTHYLEEAETLCSKIGILKQGRLLALEDKTQLLAGHQNIRVNLRLSAAPPTPNRLEAQADGSYNLQLRTEAELAPILAALCQAGIEVQHMTLHSVDLEDVFVQLVQGEPR